MSLDWQINEERDLAAVDAPTPGATPRPWLTRGLTWGMIALLLLTAGYLVGQRLVQRAETNLSQVENDLAEAVAADDWVTRQRTAERLAQRTPIAGLAVAENRMPSVPLTGTPVPVPAMLAAAIEDTTIRAVHLQDELALVQLYVAQPDAPWYSSPYTISRVFLEGQQGWQAIAPISTLWGQRLRVDTTYFHVDYGQRDAATVAALTPQLDILYLRLYRDLGLTPPPGQRLKIQITVVGGNNLDVTDLRYSANTLIVPPPELLPRAEGVSLAAALHHAIAFPLAVKVFRESHENFLIPCDWHSLTEGIGLWQRWENQVVPSRRYWEQTELVRQWLAAEGSPRLDDLLSTPQDCWQRPSYLDLELPAPMRYVPREALAATLIDYTVANHDRRTVAYLLRAFIRHDDWETLARDVYDMPAAELEAAWQAHLATLYP